MQQDRQRDSDLQKASAQTGETDAAAAADPPAVPQVAAPSVAQSSETLVPRSVPTIAYRLPPPVEQTVPGPTVGAARSAAPMPAGASKSNVVLLAGAAAGLLFAGGVFHFTRRVRPRSRVSAATDRHGFRGRVIIRSSVTAEQPPITTDPADDLKRSLLELKRDLRRASEARDLRPPYGQGGSSDAIPLPPAATWLNWPRAGNGASKSSVC